MADEALATEKSPPVWAIDDDGPPVVTDRAPSELTDGSREETTLTDEAAAVLTAGAPPGVLAAGVPPTVRVTTDVLPGVAAAATVVLTAASASFPMRCDAAEYQIGPGKRGENELLQGFREWLTVRVPLG